ncbi:MAG TPA: WHG domain-containing protein [Gemmatimonadaceae bacterium]|jgi:AcrR family transcriptional regulator
MPANKRTNYHHGALRDALLASAEKILKKEGLQALTLRAIAREAKVSHAAPAHHFRDLTDLLSELAASGFERMSASMEAECAKKPDPRSAAHAYVAFAVAHPALFQLMFRGEKLDNQSTTLRAARDRALRSLAGAKAPAASTEMTLDRVGQMTAGWSLVHGFAMLLIDGPLNAMFRLAPQGTDTMALLDAALNAVNVGRSK